MANVFLKAETILSTALGLLERELILPRLMQRMGLPEFRGAKNDTVTIRVPAVLEARDYEWRTRTAEIVMDELEESSISVTLDQHPYSAVAVTDEQLTLDIMSFGEQVLRPQVRAVAEKLEGIAYTAMTGSNLESATINLSAGGGVDYDEDGKEVLVAINEARRRLNIKNVPAAGRVILVGADVEMVLLNAGNLVEADKAGDNTALRDATIGRLSGMPVIVSNSIPSGEAWVFHPSAFVFANVAPVVPDGVTFGSSQSFEGLAMRWIRDYDPRYLRDRSVVSAFAGAGSTEDYKVNDPAGENVRAVKIALTGS